MNSRISYISIDGNEKLKVSKSFIISNRGTRYKVFLDLEKMEYRIHNALKRRWYTGKNKINNINVLKRAAKRHLLRLGCRFKEEVRNRTFGICEKGYSQQKHINRQNKQAVPSIPKDSNLE